MKMKLLILVFLLIVALTACAPAEETPDNEEEGPDTDNIEEEVEGEMITEDEVDAGEMI